MRKLLATMLVLGSIAGGCAGSVTDQVEGQPGAEVWRTATLRDVVTGQEFTIRDLVGKVVAIETMAIWCVNCRLQQAQAREALALVASPDVVFISLDVDPNERADDLAEYARREKYGWRFVVASRDVARSLAATFGDQILSPPSTPLIILGPDGVLIQRHLGVMGAGELAGLFNEHLP